MNHPDAMPDAPDNGAGAPTTVPVALADAPPAPLDLNVLKGLDLSGLNIQASFTPAEYAMVQQGLKLSIERIQHLGKKIDAYRNKALMGAMTSHASALQAAAVGKARAEAAVNQEGAEPSPDEQDE